MDALLLSHWIRQVTHSDYWSSTDLVEQKGPEIRTGLTREGKDVRRSTTPTCYTERSLKWPIPAGHEFILTTDPKYSEACDDQVMWVDYVRYITRHRSTSNLLLRLTSPRSLHQESSST